MTSPENDNAGSPFQRARVFLQRIGLFTSLLTVGALALPPLSGIALIYFMPEITQQFCCLPDFVLNLNVCPSNAITTFSKCFRQCEITDDNHCKHKSCHHVFSLFDDISAVVNVCVICFLQCIWNCVCCANQNSILG